MLALKLFDERQPGATGVARIFVLGRPALHQSCTRLKLSREAGDLSPLQQSAEL